MKDDQSHLLRDDITGDWVIVAPGRRFRPDGLGVGKKFDPFSLQHLEKERVIATYGQGDDQMTAIHNLFPIFHPDREVFGRQEIIVEGKRAMPFWDSSVARIAALMEALTERFRDIRRDKLIKYVQAFKNEGAGAGASQPHPHSQIFAMSFVPERLRYEARRRRSALKRLGMTSHGYAGSLATKNNLVYADREVVAFANPAARFAYEVRIMPRRKVDNLSKTSVAERRSLAKALHTLLPLMKKRKFAYNFFFHDVLDEHDEQFEIRFIPRVQIFGGFELDAGVYVNPVPSEIAAEEYRKARR